MLEFDMVQVFLFVSVLLSCLCLLHSAVDGNISMPVCQESFSCPGLGPLKYPFYNVADMQCGLIKINCTTKEIQFGGWLYEFVGQVDSDLDSENIAIYNRTFQQLLNNKSCDALMNNFTARSPSPLLYSTYILPLSLPIITLFKCRKNLTYPQQKEPYFEEHNYTSYSTCQDHNFYYNYLNETVPSDLPHKCQVVQLPVKLSSSPGLDETDIFTLLSPVTAIVFNLSDSCRECQKRGRHCETTKDGPGVRCFNVIKVQPGGEQIPILNRGKQGRKKTGVKILVIAGATIVLILSLVIFIIWQQFLGVEKRKIRWRKNAKYNVKVEMFLKNHEFLAPKRYSYSQVEMMTNSFKFKLGQGGFGTVYKGVLGNQNLVAVKVLSELKGDGEDFINEVASVGRTSHVNIVSLIGFCVEGRKKALIYEFMPNGSLEGFIYNRASLSNNQLGWEKLYQIAVGIARGLEYLHRGCSTRILHFDIKPHNILLDNDFCPKISDFGLAKLFREKESKISVSHMRGTPGYIAPELISRNFGEVSHKSDVYSYGMMILEMVGGRKNIEVGVDHTSQIYFPHWIYKKVELDDKQLELHGIVCDEENRIARKMIIAGLWCIQTNPLCRPTITRVLEMLEGDLASLEIPPKPYLSSPPRSPDTP